MAKVKQDHADEAPEKPSVKKFCASAVDYPMHAQLITEGTEEEAIKAFQAKHGLDFLNLKWNVEEVV